MSRKITRSSEKSLGVAPVDSLSASCWPPVLPDGCDLNLLNGFTKSC